MKLAHLIDLEIRLAADAERPPEELRRRDGVPDLPSDADDRTLLAAWVDAVAEEPRLGPKLSAAFTGLRAALFGVGLVSGWGAAAAVLRYDGSTPVNVLSWLGVLVLPQLLLLPLLLFGVLLVLRPDLPGRALGERPLLRLLWRWFADGFGRALRGLDEERSARYRAGLHRLRSRAVLYRKVEARLLLEAAQLPLIALNLGALLCLGQRVAFSDLAFAWSTTLNLTAEQVHDLVRALALPWREWLPQALPSEELVRISRWSRLEGRYLAAASGRAVDSLAVGAWWPFCTAALVAWGLVPRLAVWLFALVAGRVALARVPLDRPEIAAALERLRPRGLSTGAGTLPATEAHGAPGASGAASSAGPAWASSPSTPALALLWRDIPLDEAEARRLARGPVAAVLPVGGLDARDEEQALIAALPLARRAVVLAEAWEAPDKAMLHLLRRLRAGLGDGAHILLMPLVRNEAGRWEGAETATLVLWREITSALEDPSLHVTLPAPEPEP